MFVRGSESVILCLLLLIPEVPAPMDILYPYGPSAGDTTAPRIDDGFHEVSLSQSIKVMGKRFNKLLMNTNGLVSFGGKFTDFDPEDFSEENSAWAFLAPFWVDWSFELNVGAAMYSREVMSDEELTTVTRDIRSGLASNSRMIMNPPFTATYMVVLTYSNATHWGGNENTARNTVQVAIVTDGSRTFAIYHYGMINWSFLGPYAKVGYGNSSGMTYLHPNSSTASIALVEHTSNVHVDGRIVLQIDITCDRGWSDSVTSEYLFPSPIVTRTPLTAQEGLPPSCFFGTCLEDGWCLCYDGYTGYRCEVEIDECSFQSCGDIMGLEACSLGTCRGRGTCQDFIDDWLCDCDADFTGKQCESKVKSCANHECENGDCQETETAYACDCMSGYTGTFCDDEIDECQSCPCSQGQCFDLINAYSCTCNAGFTGKNCDVDIDYCAGNPCYRGGYCQDDMLSYNCFCHDGFDGKQCQINVDECADNMCVHGNCIDGDNSYRCDCNPGYNGELCNQNINECDSSPCQDGSCEDGVDGYTCSCDPGYTGVWCQVPIDYCWPNPCQNGGSCNEGQNTYSCNCTTGYIGTNCETNVNDCQPDPCGNGTCVDGVDGFTCECFPGYLGELCQTETSECQTLGVLCINGTCVDEAGSFYCQCTPGFTGYFCDENIDDCTPGACGNGFCIDQVSDYDCRCYPGYTGNTCQTNINECDSGPCQDNGTCIDVVNGYVCDCLTGRTGQNCEVGLPPPAVGDWGAWGDWSSCTKLCDNGLHIRYRPCLREPCIDSNNQEQLCNTRPCAEDYHEDHGEAIYLETIKTELEVAQGEELLKATIADLLNVFCDNRRHTCCKLAHVSQVELGHPFELFTADDIMIAHSYPRSLEEHKKRVKIYVRTTLEGMASYCRSDEEPRVRRDADDLTEAESNFSTPLYIPRRVVETTIKGNIARLNQAYCCWYVVEGPDKTMMYVLMGILIPLGITLFLVALLCLYYPGHHPRIQDDGELPATATPATFFIPRLFPKRPRLMFRSNQPTSQQQH